MLTVHVVNTYTCGRESSSDHEVREPEPGETHEEWWEEVVFPLTGDGHPCGASEHALYEAVVTSPPTHILSARMHSWEG